MNFSKFKNQIIFFIMALFYIIVSIISFLYVRNYIPVPNVSIRNTSYSISPSDRAIIGNVGSGDGTAAVSDDEAEEAAKEPETKTGEVSADTVSEPSVPAAPQPAEPAEIEVKYYTFVTTNKETILHVRTQPDINSKSIARLKPGTHGIVTEYNDEWCGIKTDKGKISGYCSNEYLSLTELSKEEYDKAAEEMGISL